MRWIAPLLLSTVLLAATACQGATTDNGATLTPAREATGARPVATVGFYQLPTAAPIAEEDARRLRALAPTEDEVGAAFPDVAPFAQELRGDLGQEYEHVDLAKHGFLASYVAFYRPPDQGRSAYITFALFDDASGASSALQEMIAGEFSAASTFDVGQGDESRGITSPSVTYVILRQGRVVAFIAMIHPGGEDLREGMRHLARDVAGKIQDAFSQ